MSTSKSPGTYHHGGLADALVASALELLQEGGTEALSLRAAARRAGVSATAPYRHFADKDALLAAVAARGFDGLAARLTAADTAGTDDRSALVGQGVAYVLFACGDPALFRLMFGSCRLADHAVLSEAGDRAFGVLGRRAAAVSGAAGAEDLTLAAWSLVHGLACLLVDGQLARPQPEHQTDPASLARRVTMLLLGAGNH